MENCSEHLLQKESGVQIWLSVQETSGLTGLADRSIRRKIDEFIYKKELCPGGKQYKILLASLPEKAKLKYYKQEYGIGEDEEAKYDVTDEEAEAEIYSQMPEWQRKYVDKFLPALKAAKGLKGKRLKMFLKQYRKDNDVKGLSYGNFMKVKVEYEQNGIAGIAPDYGKNAGKTTINDEDFEYFKELYLKEGSPTLWSCWIGTKGFAIKRNEGVVPEEFPAAVTFYRRLKREVSESSICLAREGKEAHNRKYKSYLNRDFSEIRAGEVWVSDHHQVDQAVMAELPKEVKEDVETLLRYYERDNRKKRKPFFPWITGWRCFKTGKWLGWNLHIEAPNSDHIFQSFFHACIRLTGMNGTAAIPDDIVIDNGKDYRARDFAGGKKYVKVKVDERKTRSLMAALNITVHFGIVKNAQTKPIERDFLLVKKWLAGQMPGYRGGHIKERPGKLLDEIKRGKIVNFDYYTQLFDSFVEDIINKYKSWGKGCMGKSREQAFADDYEPLRCVTEDSLKMFCMRTSADLTIKRNGIVLNQRHSLYYYAHWMDGQKGRKVYIRRDNNKYQEAWVFDSKTDKYLGKAFFRAWDAAAIARDDMSKKQVQELIKAQKEGYKIDKSYLPDTVINPGELVENMAIGIASLQKEKPQKLKAPTLIESTPADQIKHTEKKRQAIGSYNLKYEEMMKKDRTFYLHKYEKKEGNGKDN